MASREEIQRLRQLASQRHRAASQKVSRLRKKDVEIAGTRLDPRREPALLKRYTEKQLKSYISKLDSFVSRETNFVRGAGKATLDANLYKTYKRLESAVNRKNAAPYESVKGIFLTSAGMTVEQSMGTKPVHPTTGNPSSRAPHIPIQKSPKSFPNDKQLRKAMKDLQTKLASDYTDKMIARDKRITSKFLRTIGKINKSADLKEVRKDYKDLTPGQFAFMWNYTKFSEISSFDYEIAKSKLNDPKSLSQFDAAFDTQIREMRKIIKEVKGLDL